MTKFLKENWFVALIAVFFLGVTLFVTIDQNKGKLPGKTSGGKDVVFSVDSTDFTADELYDELSKSYKEGEVYMNFHKALLDESVKLTDEETKNLENQYANLVAYYQQNYGYSEEYLNQIAQYYYGYSTFKDYMIYSNKAQSLYEEYIKAHVDELYTEEIAANLNGRIVSYVVIAMDDPANPTEEEAAKLKEAQDAWASGEYSADNFADFATKYTQDSGQSNGGKFGFISSKTTGVDQTFIDTSLSLKTGEVSDWVFSKDFGYFLIKCDSADVKDFLEEADFVSAILEANEGLSPKIMWEKAQELGVTFGNEEIEEIVKKNLGLNESEEK